MYRVAVALTKQEYQGHISVIVTKTVGLSCFQLSARFMKFERVWICKETGRVISKQYAIIQF
jgi:hypothetical protein